MPKSGDFVFGSNFFIAMFCAAASPISWARARTTSFSSQAASSALQK